jgi:hypothetical protein
MYKISGCGLWKRYPEAVYVVVINRISHNGPVIGPIRQLAEI